MMPKIYVWKNWATRSTSSSWLVGVERVRGMNGGCGRGKGWWWWGSNRTAAVRWATRTAAPHTKHYCRQSGAHSLYLPLSCPLSISLSPSLRKRSIRFMAWNLAGTRFMCAAFAARLFRKSLARKTHTHTHGKIPLKALKKRLSEVRIECVVG